MEPVPAGRPMAVISPHLDDGIFSCGDLLARHPGSLVITVFAGLPKSGDISTEWDRKCGFNCAVEAMRARHEEDQRALSLVGAKPRWMAFADSQYGETPELDVLVERMLDVIRDITPSTVLIPAGLFHSDHELVHTAALPLFRHINGASLLMYEDALYRSLPGLLVDRLALLREAGYILTPVSSASSSSNAPKADAVRCYASQIRALETVWPDWQAEVMQPERYWRLSEKNSAT